MRFLSSLRDMFKGSRSPKSGPSSFIGGTPAPTNNVPSVPVQPVVLHEGDQVMETFSQHMGVSVIRVDAEDRFFNALEGLDDPEHKRKKIGNLFIEIFEEFND